MIRLVWYVAWYAFLVFGFLILLAITMEGCNGTTITFQPIVSDIGYYPPPPPVVYYHRHYQYGRWIPSPHPGVLVCTRYQGCTWR